MVAFSPIARGPLAASGGANYALSVTSGTFTLSMQGAGKLITDIYPSGTFAISGSELGLLVGENIFAESGQFTYSFSEFSIALGKGVEALNGSFTFSGKDVGFSVQRLLDADSGSFTLAGQDIPAILDISYIVDATAFSVTMSDIDRIGANYDIVADAGSFTATFQDNRVGRVISTDTLENMAYTLKGHDAVFRGFFSAYVPPETWSDAIATTAANWTEAA